MRCDKLYLALLTLLLSPCLSGQTPAPVTVPSIPGVVRAGAQFTLLKQGLKSSEGTISAPDGTLYLHRAFGK